VHLAELEKRFGSLTCATAEDVKKLIEAEDLPVVSSEAIRTKGWYGGAPLVMQMQAALRRTDLALSLLAFNHALHGQADDLTDMWKSSLILQDCHLQWLLADLSAHYLPIARNLESEVGERLDELAGSETESNPAFAFNPLPHRRSGVVRAGEKYVAFRNVEPASAVAFEKSLESKVVATPTSLQNNRIRVELGPAGEILAVQNRDGKTLYDGRANRLRHWINKQAEGEFLLRSMDIWDEPFSGCLRLETEVEAPETGTYTLFFDVVRGMIVAMAREDEDWIRVTNPHWAGGLPSGNQEHGYSQTGELKLLKGPNRIVIHAVADEGFKMRDAVLRVNGSVETLKYWQARKIQEWSPDPFVVEKVDVREEGARAAVEFHGRFSTCDAVLTVSLDDDSPRVDVSLSRTYRQRVYEGMQTLPLPAEIGSYLGGYCERPYVPAFTIEHETHLRHTLYSSDKPYGFSEAHDSDRSWTTARFRGFFGGMAPFLGIFAAIAESPSGSLAMLTDGHGHFFRRRPYHDETETLGLSLGSSIIHPMTQNYRVSAGSYWEKISRPRNSVDYDDAHERFDFICPEGEISCGWSLVFSNDASIKRQTCHEQLLERLFPLLTATAPIAGGFQLVGEEVILGGLEQSSDGLIIRLVNLSDKAQPFDCTLPWEVKEAKVTSDMPIYDPAWSENHLTGRLPPLALREFIVSTGEKLPQMERRVT
jgi:hypothetical protein